MKPATRQCISYIRALTDQHCCLTATYAGQNTDNVTLCTLLLWTLMQLPVITSTGKGRDSHPSKSKADDLQQQNYILYTLIFIPVGIKKHFSRTFKNCLGLLFCSFIIGTLWIQKNCIVTLQGAQQKAPSPTVPASICCVSVSTHPLHLHINNTSFSASA